MAVTPDPLSSSSPMASVDDAGALREGQDIGTAGMATGQGIDLAPPARSKLTPSPYDERQHTQHDSGQDQSGGLCKDGHGSGRRTHWMMLSGRIDL